jgi:predicted nucleotidyltransferase
LTEAARILAAERSDVAAVYLFGSLPDGRAVPGSDADLLILLEHSVRRWLDRPVEFQRYFSDIGLPVELFCYTRAEVERTPFAQSVIARGALLAGR